MHGSSGERAAGVRRPRLRIGRGATALELTADKSADLSDVALVPKASPTEGDILL